MIKEYTSAGVFINIPQSVRQVKIYSILAIYFWDNFTLFLCLLKTSNFTRFSECNDGFWSCTRSVSFTVCALLVLLFLCCYMQNFNLTHIFICFCVSVFVGSNRWGCLSSCGQVSLNICWLFPYIFFSIYDQIALSINIGEAGECIHT